MDNYEIQAMAIIETSGLAGIQRIEEWIDDHRVSYFYKEQVSYQRALILYAESIGIKVNQRGNVTYNGFYRLSDAIAKGI
jgi:hypothetical protein